MSCVLFNHLSLSENVIKFYIFGQIIDQFEHALLNESVIF